MATRTNYSLDQLRARIGALQSEREAVMRAGKNRDEVRAALHVWLSALAETGNARLSTAIAELVRGERQCGAFTTLTAVDMKAVDLGPLIVGLVGAETVADALERHVEARIPDELPDATQRAARLADISSELDELEAREEQLIEASERDGRPILRRGDARPEIVLAAREG